MVTFKKEELDFIQLYSLCSDTKEVIYDKVSILLDSSQNKVKFIQVSSEATLITEFNKEVDEDISLVVPVTTLNSLLKLSPANTDVGIIKDGFKINKSSYRFEDFPIDLSNEDDLTNTSTIKKLEINELSKLSKVKYYMGSEDLEAIGLFNGCFVASNNYDATGVVKTSNPKDRDNFYLSSKIIDIANFIKTNELVLNFIKDDVYYIKINDTLIYIRIWDYNLPNIFDEEYIQSYRHQFNSTFNKKILLEKLKRISIIASDNLDSRIFLTFKNNNLHMESRDGNLAEEFVPAQYSSQLEDCSIVLSSSYLLHILSSLDGESIIFEVSPEENCPAITIKDETDNNFYIHCLYDAD